MSETDGKKPLGLGGARPGQVKQSFSHGRTKSVIVETKKKRIVVAKPGAPAGSGGTSPSLGDPSKRPAGISDAEMERRLKALQAAKAREAYDQLIASALRYDPDADIFGVMLTPMLAGGVECIIGSSHDVTFGPTVMFGLGGIFVEVL